MPLSRTSPDNLPPRLSFRVPPEPSHLLRARERLRDYLRQYCASPEAIDDCVLCVEEACTNAIRHSGAADEIEISLAFEAERLVAQVKDRGRGFDTAAFDPAHNPDPSADHGRGLFIIAALMDSLELRLDGGLEVRMARAAQPHCEPQPLESGLGEPRAAGAGHREARTRAMLEEIDEAFFALDWEYRYVHANQAALRITGKPLEELLGRTPWEVFPQLEGSLLEEHYRQAMELGAPSVFEHRSVVTDDWLEIRIYPTSAGVSAYYREINERKQVEQELQLSREREHLLAEVVEKADVAFAIREPDGRLVLFNQAFAELTGYSREELEEGASTLAVELTPPDWWETETPLLAQAVAERRPVRFEKEYVRKDGSRAPIEVFAQPVFDDAGGLVHYRSFLTDITARKQVGETLRESEERFRSLFESMAEGVVLHEVVYEEGRAVDYRILDVNPSFEVQTGVTTQSARGRLASELYGTGEAPYLAEYAQVAEGGRPYSFETYFEPMERHFRITAISPARGRFATVFEDITERIRAELESQRLLEESQAQAEELQTQSEELQTLGEELQVQNEELLAQRDAEAQAQQRVERELEATNLLLEVATAATSWTDLDQMLGSLGDLLLRSTHHSRVLLELWDEERREIEIAVSRGAAATARQRFPFDSISDGAKEVIATRKTLVIDYTETALPAPQKEYVDEHAFLLLLVVPIVYRERLIGLVTLDEPGERRPFSPHEIQLVEAIAGQAGAAIENARLYEEAVERERLGAALNDIAISIAGPLDYEEILTRVVGQTGAAVGAESSAIYSLGAGELVPTHLWQLPAESLGVPIPRSRTPYVDIAVAGRQVVAVDDCETDPRVDVELQHEWNVRSVTAAPLVVRDAVVGAMFFNFHTRQHRFTAPEIDFVGKAAAAVSGALENARLFEEQQSQGQKLQVQSGKLQAQGEEMQAQSEELQAQSEELQVQSEELQSQNEELQAQSEELQVQTDELRAHSADLAERGRLAEALNDIGGFVHSTLDFDDIMQRALELGVQTLAVDAGAVEMRDGAEWVVRYQSGFAAADLGLRLSSAEAPNASVAERRQETFAITDMSADDTVNVGFVRSHALRSVLAVPLMVKETVVGCLLFYGRQARAFDEAETDFGRKLGVTASLAVENARLIEDEREATRLGTTLNEINRLIHGTLDADEIMQRVVAQSVKAVGADSAMIALKHGDDWVAEYGYPAVPGVIHESVSTSEAPFVLAAATTRLPVAIDDCTSDPRCIPEVQGRFGVRSVLCIPLIVRDEVIGVVFFNHHAEAVKFEPRTVDFAGKLAAAISAALENAQLYAAQQRIAVTLQENLIHPLPQIPGLELASVSATAFQPDLVGGDFADAFRLPDGRVLLLIGDVMGKGVKAAGLTETARTAVRAVALTTPSADDILPNVNRVLIRETDQLVTVLLALLDIRTGEAFLSSAGHPPPVHLSAAGAILVETGFGPPLGALEYPYKAGRVHLAPGDALVLYTDGVTEARKRGEFFGEAGLLAALRSVEGRRPQLLVDTLHDAVADFADRLTDDLHVLALRLSS